MTPYEAFVQATRTYRTALDQARAFTDPDLSEDGQIKRRQDMAGLAEERERKAVDAAANQLRSTATTTANRADHARPALPDDSLTAVRVQASFDVFKAHLAAGKGLPSIIYSADQPSALAARELAEPLAGLVGATAGHEDITAEDIRAAIDHRLAKVGPTSFALAHQAALDAGRDAAAAEETLARLATLGTGQGHELEAAIAAQYARAGAGEPGAPLKQQEGS